MLLSIGTNKDYSSWQRENEFDSVESLSFPLKLTPTVRLDRACASDVGLSKGGNCFPT